MFPRNSSSVRSASIARPILVEVIGLRTFAKIAPRPAMAPIWTVLTRGPLTWVLGWLLQEKVVRHAMSASRITILDGIRVFIDTAFLPPREGRLVWKGKLADPNRRRTLLSSQNGTRSGEVHGSLGSEGCGASAERALGRASNPTITMTSSAGKRKSPGVSR